MPGACAGAVQQGCKCVEALQHRGTETGAWRRWSKSVEALQHCAVGAARAGGGCSALGRAVCCPHLRANTDVGSKLHQPNRRLRHTSAKQGRLVQWRPALSTYKGAGSMSEEGQAEAQGEGGGGRRRGAASCSGVQPSTNSTSWGREYVGLGQAEVRVGVCERVSSIDSHQAPPCTTGALSGGGAHESVRRVGVGANLDQSHDGVVEALLRRRVQRCVALVVRGLGRGSVPEQAAGRLGCLVVPHRNRERRPPLLNKQAGAGR